MNTRWIPKRRRSQHANLAGSVLAGSMLILAAPAWARGGDEAVSDATKASDAKPSILGEGDSAWAYLSGKYDTNGDDKISTGEYDRGEKAYARLDRNHDGTIDATDFASTGGGMGRGGMRSMMAPMTLLRLFQADDDEDSLDRGEIAQSFPSFDTNGDGRIDQAEFDAGAKGHASGMMAMMGGFQFEPLYDEADDDDDSALSLDELEAYFDWRDSDHNGTWTMGGPRGRGGHGMGAASAGGDSGSAGSGEDVSEADRDALAAVGKVAPDFSLRPPKGGDETTLSSFAGQKPVALIFGSYT